MISIIKISTVAIHHLFFLFAQLFILQINGIGYSGSLAYIGAVSTILAVVINLRSDIEVMVRSHLKLSECLFDSSITIFLMTITVIFFNLIIGSPLPSYIIFSAIMIAIHELLVSILFIQEKIYSYSLFRTIPALALIFLAFIGFEAETIWPASFALSAFFLIIHFSPLFKQSFLLTSLNKIKEIKFIQKFYASITASTVTFFSASFVIIINYYHGSEYVGLWSNTIRIFNSIIIFLLGVSLPFALKIIRDKDTNSEKVKTFFYLWILLCPLIILSYLFASNLGAYILSFFVSFDFVVSNTHLGYIVLISAAVSFIGSSNSIYQSLNKSIPLLFMVFISAVAGLILIFISHHSFISLIEAFLISIVSLASMVCMNLLFVLIYSGNDSKP